ncbi:MAG: bifunctional [glutamate--ammonia ligase]-adenylyl-L-tyrosine phosphorylase/[glutamate--ammonia-ligase] adenylyltransferase [Gammaproteobacteria bacterium]|nr:bifunctional [glutamate--ammonia ligase]-adenylyl-L-tyrosine phosphorylase/[glutamate--ammonia-ligase] adenylyltransferase [Gammaproteobacteria bacterium]
MARSLGYDGYDAYLTALAAHRSRVEAVFERLLVTDAPDPDRDLWASRSVPLALARAGFGDGAEAVALLDELAKARDRASVGEAGRHRLNELMPRLLQALSLAKDPLQGLTRLVPLLRAVLRRSTYLALLRDHPEVAERLVRVACRSRWLAEQIRQRPRLLSLLIDRPSVKLAPDRQALFEALGQQLAEVRDEEALLEELRAFKERHVFQVAAAEALGGLALMHVSDYLTRLAEAVLEHSLKLAWDQCELRHGAPEGLEGRPFVIVGYGKLGGIELGPGSDLDIVFVHDLPLAHVQFAHRLVRKLLHYLTAPTYLGPLYEVDMRLRPSGNAGTLMTSLKAFVEYQRSNAWVWEHQALVRARAVAGDAELQRRFEQTRIDFLCQPRAAEALRAEVNQMRQRIAAHQRGEDLKRGRGGIVDIEFMVQYIVLAHAHEEPALARHSDNVRILEAAKETGVLDSEDADRLTRAYLALRERHHREVLDLKGEGGDAELAVHRGVILDLWQRLLEQPPA